MSFRKQIIIQPFVNVPQIDWRGILCGAVAVPRSRHETNWTQSSLLMSSRDINFFIGLLVGRCLVFTRRLRRWSANFLWIDVKDKLGVKDWKHQRNLDCSQTFFLFWTIWWARENDHEAQKKPKKRQKGRKRRKTHFFSLTPFSTPTPPPYACGHPWVLFSYARSTIFKEKIEGLWTEKRKSNLTRKVT